MGEEAAHESEAIDSWWNRQRPRPLQEGESGAIRHPDYPSGGWHLLGVKDQDATVIGIHHD